MSLQRLFRLCSFFGLDPKSLILNARGVSSFLRDLRRYNQMGGPTAFRISFRDMRPCLSDRYAAAGTFHSHYFHQDLWAARKIFERRPHKHLDVGSRLDGFVAHVLAFMPVTVLDLRPLEADVEGLLFVRDDATSMSHFDDNSIDSLSSLNVAEHFGLGRYSDAVDPNGCFQFMSALERVLSPGGRLYFSVPIGRERVEFNAHRVFGVETVLSSFPRLTVVSFSFVDDDGQFHKDVDPAEVPRSEYACGLFEFTKAPAVTASVA